MKKHKVLKSAGIVVLALLLLIAIVIGITCPELLRKKDPYDGGDGKNDTEAIHDR